MLILDHLQCWEAFPNLISILQRDLPQNTMERNQNQIFAICKKKSYTKIFFLDLNSEFAIRDGPFDTHHVYVCEKYVICHI